MTLKEQLYVCTLARCQTITRAAEELYISQPALSTYISNLEKYLGVKLFERTGKSFLLTAIGEEYVKRAEKMLELKEEFDELLREETGRRRDTLRVAVQQRRAISLIPYVMSRFARQYPEVNLLFKEANHNELVQMFQAGTVDMAIGIYKDDFPGAGYIELGREYVLAAISKDHPAVKNAYEVPGDEFLHLDLECLDKEKFILPSKEQSMRKTAERIMEQYRIKPGYIYEMSNFSIIMAMVNENLGIGFNRLGYVNTMREMPNVRYFFIGEKPYSSRLVMAYRKEKKWQPYMDDFVQLVQEAVNNDNYARHNV